MLVTKITSKAQAPFDVPCNILFGLSIDIISFTWKVCKVNYIQTRGSPIPCFKKMFLQWKIL